MQVLLHRLAPYLSPAELQAFCGAAELRELARRDRLRQEGAGAQRVGLIVAGILRAYYETADGVVSPTLILRVEGDSFGVPRSLTAVPHPGRTYVYEAVEAATVLAIDFGVLVALGRDHPGLQRLLLDNVLANVMALLSRVEGLLSLKPAERYDYLVERRPELLARVPRKYVAEYLGITPVSLSRISARRLGGRARN